MFARKILFLTIIAAFGGFLWIGNLAFVRKGDLAAYKAMSRKTREVAKSREIEGASQKRRGVRKDIWLAQEAGNPLHTRIDSEASTLTLLPVNEKIDIIENLEKIRCWMQDRLFVNNGASSQQMRFFEADAGTYQYTTQQFLAKTVELSFFRLPGHDLAVRVNPEEAFLRGIASNVSFSVSGKSPKFQAERFQALLQSQHEEARR